MKGLLKTLPYIITNCLSFFLLPLMIVDTGAGMFVLLILIPIICFISSIFCGYFAGNKWYYPVIVALLFIPTIFIYYNTSALFYVVEYGLTAFISMLIGNWFKNLKKSNKDNTLN